MTTIIDYDAGSLRNVGKAPLSLGETPTITRNRKAILKANKVILPGVGSPGDTMGKLKRYSLVDVIYETVGQGAPFLGICLGLQLLFVGSKESHGVVGLGILPGKIPKILEHLGLKIPYMGWNLLKIRSEAELSHGAEDGAYVHFARSYYLKVEDESAMAASIEYSTIIHASVKRGNVFVCQSHPEKSGKVGLTILRDPIGL